ncbi:hypothetical protein LX32DRAFT_258542 [Colletotrichum zoysiae]|uniref:Uncharacterized protein n=1 Tax=Colletotrichum zoysiae TaxID=1216348 RepID=A0AAD9LU84_9PEZI|nr:hypothetical protein LX32DRAFT_258542 [Colletotrichum zoysiae]
MPLAWYLFCKKPPKVAYSNRPPPYPWILQQGQEGKGSIAPVAPKRPIPTGSGWEAWRRGGGHRPLPSPNACKPAEKTSLLIHFHDISFPPPRPDFFFSSFPPPFFNNNFVQLSLSLLYVGRIACCHSLFTFGYSPSFHSFSNIALTNTPPWEFQLAFT